LERIQKKKQREQAEVLLTEESLLTKIKKRLRFFGEVGAAYRCRGFSPIVSSETIEVS
jgi:hypothetical protein